MAASVLESSFESPVSVSASLLFSLLLLLLLLSHHPCVSTVHAAASTDDDQQAHIVYLGDREKQHNNPTLITNSHHHMLSLVLGSKEGAAEAMTYSYTHGFSRFAAKLIAFQAQKFAGN
ncbi:hypothetical protein ACLOJK_030379 [Asimina triloba]